MSLKRNIRVLSLALAALFAFSGLVAAAAQATAPHWTVEGATPTPTTFGSRALVAESTGTPTLSGGGLTLKTDPGGVKGDCTSNGNIASSAPGVPSTVNQVTLTCTTVHAFSGATTLATCTVHSPGQPDGTVKTNDLDGVLVWMAATGDKKAGITFTPEVAGTNFALIEVTGASCPLAGSFPVTGNVIATGVEEGLSGSAITKDVTEGTLLFPSTPDTHYWTNQTPTRTEDTDTGLKLGAAAAVFSAEFDAKLGAGGKVGIEPN